MRTLFAMVLLAFILSTPASATEGETQESAPITDRDLINIGHPEPSLSINEPLDWETGRWYLIFFGLALGLWGLSLAVRERRVE